MQSAIKAIGVFIFNLLGGVNVMQKLVGPGTAVTTPAASISPTFSDLYSHSAYLEINEKKID